MTGVVCSDNLIFIAGDDGYRYKAPDLDATLIGKRVEFDPVETAFGRNAENVSLFKEVVE